MDGSNQDEPSFGKLNVAEMEDLAEIDLGEPGEGVQMQDETANGKGLKEAYKAGAKNVLIYLIFFL